MTKTLTHVLAVTATTMCAAAVLTLLPRETYAATPWATFTMGSMTISNGDFVRNGSVVVPVGFWTRTDVSSTPPAPDTGTQGAPGQNGAPGVNGGTVVTGDASSSVNIVNNGSNNPSTGSGSNNGGATTGNGGAGGAGGNGGTVETGRTTSRVDVFNSTNRTVIDIRLGH